MTLIISLPHSQFCCIVDTWYIIATSLAHQENKHRHQVAVGLLVIRNNSSSRYSSSKCTNRTWHIHLYCMKRVEACAGLSICSWSPKLFLFFCVCSALLLLPYHVCFPPPLKTSSSLKCGSHGTTAFAEQACVDHVYACVGILNTWV